MEPDEMIIIREIKSILQEEISALEDRLDIKFEQKLDQKFDEKLAVFEKKIMKRMDDQVSEISTILNTSLDAVGERLEDHEQRILRLEVSPV